MKLLYILILLIIGAYYLYKKQFLFKSIYETIKINPTIRGYIIKALSLLLFRRFRWNSLNKLNEKTAIDSSLVFEEAAVAAVKKSEWKPGQ